MKREKGSIKEKFHFLLVILIVLLLNIGLITFSKNYQKIYHTPILNHTILDLTGYDINHRKVDYNLTGEWEFYYNQWIVTDHIEPNKTGVIHLPNRWSEQYHLSRKGYASYKITIKNPNIGDKYAIVLNNFRGTYQAFIDNKLVTKCGDVSKEKNQNFAKGRVTYRDYYLVEEHKDLELVIEIGYNTFGGFYSVPWLTTSSFNDNTTRLSNKITFLILFMIGSMFCFCMMSLILNLGIYKKESLIYYSVLLVVLFLHQFTSKDACLILTQFDNSLDYNIYANLNLFLTGIIIISYVYFLKKSSLIKRNIYILNSLAILISIVSVLLFGYAYLYIIPIVLCMICQVMIVFEICINHYLAKVKRVYYHILTILLFSILTMELFDSMGLIVFGTEGIISMLILIFMIIIAITNYVKIREISRENIHVLEVENELQKVKEKTLRAQIKPHFIFNTLTCIQYLYHENTEQGDQALSIFSKHLRLNVDTETKELIPFEEELDNIQNYFQLENMRYSNKINLYYDINTIDFEIPILSLQPFVENSIKHGRLMEKEDGWIQISSKEENEKMIIKIIDNGIGFNPSEIRLNATGIANCKERFRILLNAKIKIDSVINKGTIIEISFDKIKEGDEQNESNCCR